MVIFHERNIRKADGPFSFLVNTDKRDRFIADLSHLMDNMSFTLIASIIQKPRLCERYLHPRNPYHLALGFGLERIFSFLKHQEQHDRITHIVVESRGRREDEELEAEFRLVCSGVNFKHEILPFRLKFADKKCNSCGLQIADLIARPIGRKMMNPAEQNRAYEIITRKFYRKKEVLDGWGLKVFP